MSVRIYLTGRVGVAVEAELVIRERQFRDRQGRRAFAYLVSCLGRPVTRGELAEVVWPDELPAAWESGLSALMSRIRTLLGSGGLSAQGISLSGGFGQYRLDLPATTWVDVEASTMAIDEAESALKVRDLQRAFGAAGIVHAIASRPFLSGDDGEWVQSQRRMLERQFVRALDCLSNVWLAMGESVLAVETAARAVTADPFRESSYLLLMRAHLATGNRPEAIRVYHRLRDLLVAELGTDPSAETESFYLELLR